MTDPDAAAALETDRAVEGAARALDRCTAAAAALRRRGLAVAAAALVAAVAGVLRCRVGTAPTAAETTAYAALAAAIAFEAARTRGLGRANATAAARHAHVAAEILRVATSRLDRAKVDEPLGSSLRAACDRLHPALARHRAREAGGI